MHKEIRNVGGRCHEADAHHEPFVHGHNGILWEFERFFDYMPTPPVIHSINTLSCWPFYPSIHPCVILGQDPFTVNTRPKNSTQPAIDLRQQLTPQMHIIHGCYLILDSIL